MGASASKQGRKLTKVVSENAKGKTLNRTSNINPLPSQTLKDRSKQSHVSTEPAKDDSHQESITQQPQDIQKGFRSASSFDPGFLSKKLNRQSVIPEGKDGGDPQVEGTDTYQKGFVNSVTELGKQIHSVEFDHLKMNKNILALQQLKSRKTISEIGEQELENEKNSANGTSAYKTMVHPHTLTAILSDLQDPRMTPESITKDYQLSPDFLKELGDKFQVPTNTMPIEEEKPPEEDQFVSAVEADEFEFEEQEGKLDRKNYEKLKGRLEI
ncbi:hypothetical protein JA1_001657 [Spathaspora sp. JA1]|nr:hypothetical protein JA1_001657 [Spathaspora sp. JA1]